MSDNLDDIIGDCNTGGEPGLSLEEVLKRYPSARKTLLEKIPEIRQDVLREYHSQRSEVVSAAEKEHRKEALYFVIRKLEGKSIEAFPFYDRATAFSYWEDAKDKWKTVFFCKILDSSTSFEAIDDHMGEITTPVRERMVDLVRSFLDDESIKSRDIDKTTLMYLVEWIHRLAGEELSYAKR